jgi:hypothetical protein
MVLGEDGCVDNPHDKPASGLIPLVASRLGQLVRHERICEAS